MKRTLIVIAILFAVLVGYTAAMAARPSYENVWTEAVERGLIQGDASYYYDGRAATEEYYHAIMTAILAVDDKVGTQSPTTTTVSEPTTSSSSTTSKPPVATTTTTEPTSTTSSSTTTTVASTTTSTSVTTSTIPAVTTTTTTVPPPGQTTVLIEAGLHNQYKKEALDDTRYLCEDGAILDGNNVKDHAFFGGADNVTIENCEITNYNTPQQHGAIDVRDGNNWTILDNEIHHNWGVGIQVKGNNLVVRGNSIHHQHQLGVASEGLNNLWEDNEVAYNNWEVDYSWGWEAGGSKFWDSDGLIIRNNYFHNNHGPGIWTDYNNINVLIEDNLIEDNWANGIFHEISYAAVIRNNTVRRNGFGHDAWLWGAGILIATSQDTEVYGNLVEDNFNGITITQQDRTISSDPSSQYYMKYGDWRAINNTIHDNVVNNSGSNGAVNDDDDDTLFTNNSWYGNTYTAPDSFAWDNGWGNLIFWQIYHPLDG